MRICVIGLRGIPFVIGGIEAHCQQLYPRLLKMQGRQDITVLIRRGYTDARAFEFEGLDVRTIWSPHVWGVDTVVHSFLAVLYARLFLAPDIVHLHGIGPGFFTPLARLLGMRTVVTHHAQDYLRPKWSWRGRAFLKSGEALVARFASAIICVSSSLYSEFLALYPRARTRTTIIRNSSALVKSQTPAANAILGELDVRADQYILAVGRLDATKSYDDLIAAFEAAAPREMKLVIAGSDIGNEEHAAELRQHASGRIIFAGFRRDEALQSLYDHAALFVHPSRMEGYGLVIAEALAVGKPIVVSDIPPHREFELPEVCYFAAGDIEALADKLRASDFSIFDAPQATRRQRADSWDRVAAQTMELYRQLVGKPLKGTIDTAVELGSGSS